MSTSTGSIGAGGETYGFFGYDDATESVKESGPTDSDTAAGEFNCSFLPPEMPVEEGFALREWRRLNSIKLAEKEKREKEALREILEEAERFKEEFYRKRQLTVENRKTSNKEKEKQFVASQESFHAEASKNYWKAIAELIPREIPNIEQRGNKKGKDKKPSISVIQGPKPGKPTDMSRMRQVVIKLKHNPPTHMMKPESPATTIKESTKGDGDGQMDLSQAENGTTSEGPILRSR